jgi:hypothetical protein
MVLEAQSLLRTYERFVSVYLFRLSLLHLCFVHDTHVRVSRLSSFPIVLSASVGGFRFVYPLPGGPGTFHPPHVVLARNTVVALK